jgi:hypothetical protein
MEALHALPPPRHRGIGVVTERDAKLEKEIARGNQARAIIEDRIFVESMERLKKEIIDKWAAAPARDTDGREWLWQHYQVALKFEEVLTEVLNTGKLAFEERKRSLIERGAGALRSAFGR